MIGTMDFTLSSPSSTGTAGSVFLNDSSQRSQGLVDLNRIRKHQRHIGVEHDNSTAHGIARRIGVWPGIAEIILWKDFILLGQVCFSLWVVFLHNPSVLGASLAAH